MPRGFNPVGPIGFAPTNANYTYLGHEVGLDVGGFAGVPLAPQEPGAETVSARIRVEAPGVLVFSRPPGFPGSCSSPATGYQPDYFVSGTQTVTVETAPRTLAAEVEVTPATLSPALNPRCGTSTSFFAVKVSARWSDGGSAQGAAISLRSEFEGGSGGHAHQPAGRQGFGSLTQSSGAANATGIFQTQYHPGIVGDIERLTAVVSQDGQTATTFAEVRIKVPDLIQLLPGANLEIGGGTAAHPDNSFGTALTIGKMLVLADTFFAQTGVRIPFNDMSLQLGGVFDLNEEFTPSEHPGHLGHRCGNEVDVVDHVGNRVSVLEQYLRDLVRSPSVRGAFFNHGAGSYHLRFER